MLDDFVEAMEAIAREVTANPELVRGASYSTPVGRLDEVAAARRPILRWQADLGPAERAYCSLRPRARSRCHAATSSLVRS